MSDVILIRSTRFVVSDCITCGVVYTVPEIVWDRHREYGGFHHCPNGHSQGWAADKDSEIAKTRRERDQLKQQIARVEDEKRIEVEQAERRAERAETAQRRLAKRVNAGLCPCCNRSFQNVARHMATKHKGIALLKAEKVSA